MSGPGSGMEKMDGLRIIFTRCQDYELAGV
jgi:hypothetical protein